MIPTQRIAAAAVLLSLAGAGAHATTSFAAADDPATPAHRAPAAVYSRPDKAMVPVTVPNADSSSISGAPAQPAVVRIQVPQSGFDWGDAGIGAAGAVALAMLGVGGALVISQRPRRTRHGTAGPN